MRNCCHSCKFCTLTINLSEVWHRQILLQITVFAARLRKVLNTSRRHLENVLTRTGYLDETSWNRLEDVLKSFLQDVLRMFWTRLQNILEMSKRCLEDVSGRRLENVLKTFWRRLGKTSWRRVDRVRGSQFFPITRTK